MNCDCNMNQKDNGPNPYVVNIEQAAMRNSNFRKAIWTGCHLQMTLMCIPPCGEIGFEMHEKTDQLIRIEQGKAVVQMGKCKCKMDFQEELCKGDGVFVPAGTWHNIKNVGNCPLRISSVYAPPNHPKGTIHRTKAEAEKAEHH